MCLTLFKAYVRIHPASHYSAAGVALPSIQDIKIKVCGITTVEDARLVAESGADYIGVIVGVDVSPRNLSLDSARLICEQSTLPVVTLFFNREAKQIQNAVASLNPHAVQLLGHETPSLVRTLKKTVTCEIWKSVHLPPQGLGEVNIAEHQSRVNSLVDAGVDAVIIDTVVGSSNKNMRYGGTGQVNNWIVARSLVEVFSVQTFLAGGITPDNIRQAIELVHPYGIDLCSGVEISPGRKDPEKLRRLMSAIGRVVPERE